jgi:5-methylcytosine-specific restriction protein A
MPMAPPRACATCGAAGCTTHRRAPWQSRAPVPRVRGRRLQRWRWDLFRDQPFCVKCGALATIRDHIVPLAEGGTDTPTNSQALCQMCSDAKTAQEAKRGGGRNV